MNQPAPYAQLSKGALLIASPEMPEEFYFRSVILLCEHTSNGSFGLILNKPLEMELPEDLLQLKQSPNPHIQMRAGGPIQPTQMMLLHSSNALSEQAMMICEGVYLGGDLQFLQEALNNPEGPYLHLCFGYTGWNVGQLEREFLSGSWFLHPAAAKYVFQAPPEKLWQEVLRDMGGKYASLSMIPEDLTLN